MLATLLLISSAALPQIPFEKYTLPNGLTVILSEDHRAPVVAIDLWYHVGAVNEREGRSGFAHLFEHLMFQGSKHLQGDERIIFSTLERAGATDLNGTTEWDRTNYFETLPKDRLELGLWLESDRMGFLLDTVDQKKLDTQREVVSNEKRQNFDDQPYGKAEQRLIQLLYPKPSPYNGYIIGSFDDLKAASLEDVKGFFLTYYAPDNASIAITGDLHIAEVKPLVEKYFGPIPRGPAKPKIEAPPAPPAQKTEETLHDKVQLAKIYLGWVGPKPLEDPAMPVLISLLTTGKSSRLYHDLVYDKKIAQDVQAQWEPGMMLGGAVELSGVVQAGHQPAEVIEGVSSEVKALQAAPPTQEELDRVKRNIRAALFSQLESIGGFGGKADILNEFEFRAGDPGKFALQLEKMLAVTPDEVQKCAQKYLNEENRVTLIVLPEEVAK